MFDALLQQGSTLLLLSIFVFLVIGLGRTAFINADIPFISSGEMVFYSSGIGFGIIGYGVFFLGLFQGLYFLPLSILLFCLLIISLAGWFWAPFPPMKSDLQEKIRSSWDRLAFFLLILCLLAGLSLTLTPEIGRDALIYHLAVPKLFLKHHGFYFIEGNIFSNYPLHSEMLFIIGLFLQGDILAKGMHFLALLFILLGMYQFTRQRMKNHDSPAVSLLIFYTMPSVFLISHMAYTDLFVVFYSMAAVFAFINWVERLEKGWLILSGVFTGLAVAGKYTALLLPFLGCLGIFWAARRHRLHVYRAFRLLILYGLVAVILGSPFYIKNWTVTGNPFYPFLYGIFGGRGWEPEQAEFYDFFVQSLGMGRGFVDYILLPWNLSFRAKMNSPQFDGVIGPLFLVALPFVFGARKLELSLKIMMLFCCFIFLFWASSAQQIRYLLHILPFLAIFTGALPAYHQRKKFIRYALAFLIAGGLAFNGYHIVHDWLNIKPVGVIFGKENRTAFLRSRLPSYVMFDFVNRKLPHDAKIFLIYMKNWTFLCERECYSDSMFESYTIQKILARSSTPAEVSSALKARGFTHILYDINYVYGRPSTFTPRDKTLFSAFQNEHLEPVRTDQSYFLYRIK